MRLLSHSHSGTVSNLKSVCSEAMKTLRGNKSTVKRIFLGTLMQADRGVSRKGGPMGELATPEIHKYDWLSVQLL